MKELELSKHACILVCSDEQYDQMLLRSLNILDLTVSFFKSLNNPFDKATIRKNRLSQADPNLTSLPRVNPLTIDDDIYSFEGGRPADGAIYVQHHIHPRKWLLPAGYQQTVETERLSIVKQIASMMGATKITVHAAWDKSSEMAGDVGISSGDAAINIGSFDAASRHGTRIEETIELIPKSDFVRSIDTFEPELMAWIQRDVELKSMVVTRACGAKSMNIFLLSYLNKHIDALAEINLAQYGVNVGGSIRRGQSTCRKITLEFCPLGTDDQGSNVDGLAEKVVETVNTLDNRTLITNLEAISKHVDKKTYDQIKDLCDEFRAKRMPVPQSN